ncbi:MAG: alkaline phosphatase D family protein [Bacteroidota bacterium]
MRNFSLLFCFVFSFFPALLHCQQGSNDVDWPQEQKRIWIGEDFWANRLQDWRLVSGYLYCVGGNEPMRTVHSLRHEVTDQTDSLRLSVTFGLLHREEIEADAFAGFLVGAGARQDDYRRRSLVHATGGKGGGWIFGINGEGRMFVYDNEKQVMRAQHNIGDKQKLRLSSLSLQLHFQGDSLQIRIINIANYPPFNILFETTIPFEAGDRQALNGNIALIGNKAADEQGKSWSFRDWKIDGAEVHPERKLGPIISSMYTLSKGRLKLTAQLMPVGPYAPKTLQLLVADPDSDNWDKIAEASLSLPAYTATFRKDNWSQGSREAKKYKIIYRASAEEETQIFEGLIQAEPGPEDELVVAGFTGNNPSFGTIGGKRFDFSRNRVWFPHEDLVTSVALHQPDMLFFSGDQIYEGRPTPADRSGGESSQLDYLYKWYLFLWAYRDLLRDRPSVCLPDDHDVYHGNIWGNGGIHAKNTPAPDWYGKQFRHHWVQDKGGYRMSPEFVNMVQATQCSHLPDPFDPQPVAQDIGVYYTNLTYGGVSFAVLEDRKFKSGPTTALPDAKVINGFSQIKDYPAKQLDTPGATLLGQRQLDFLDQWAEDWDDSWIKCVLSQTIFTNLSTYPDTFLTDAGTPRLKPLAQGVIPKDYSLAKDMDSNGWPQSGRNKALKSIRKGFAFMYAGDQHLGSIVHHGVDEWEDAGWSFCVPSVANLWPRRWFPQEKGKNHQAGLPDYTGEYQDGFGNKITVWAASNPYLSGEKPADLHDRAPGYGIVRFDKQQQQIQMECWPRYVDPSTSQKQYPGWPKQINVAENYARAVDFPLASIQTSGFDQPPVIWVYQGVELVYARRMKGMAEEVGVFSEGKYVLKVGEPGKDIKQYKLKTGKLKEIRLRK